jgi:hypothetical protein
MWAGIRLLLLVGGNEQGVADAADSYDQLELLQSLVFIVCGIFYLCWIFKAHGNLHIWGAKPLQFTSLGAVGWHFFPFLNLVRPCQVMSEIWRASDPEVPSDRADGIALAATSPLVGFWWVSYLMGNITAFVATGFVSNPNQTVDGVRIAFQILLGSDLLLIGAALLLMALIRGIAGRQAEKLRQLTPSADEPS